MKKYFNYPFVSLKQETYLSLIIFLAPCLYFLSGINVDIYAPSMPAISAYFHASIIATKNTIAISMLGWAIGALFFGVLIDSWGRKKILLIGMSLYVVSSLVAAFSDSIHMLMWIRFIQGASISSIVGSRILIVDLLSGKRYMIAMLYTAIGYGLGPVMGPFIGGFLQHYIGWRANFFALAFVSAVILILLFVFVKESMTVPHALKINQIAKRGWSVLSHKKFMAGVFIGGVTQIQLMLYPTIGPFIVVNLLHDTAITYGNSALIVGASYLTGSLMNRALLKYISPKEICDVGFIILISALLITSLFSYIARLELTTVMLPIFVTCVSAGFIFPNVLSMNLKQFTHSIGIAVAVQSFVLLLVTSVGLFLINYVHVVALSQLFYILLALAFFEIVIFFGFYRGIFEEQVSVENK